MRMFNKFIGGVLASGATLALVAAPVFASSVSTNFEGPTYTLADINGQDGWTKTGPYDAAVSSNTSGFSSFGSQSLRLSDAVTSGSFGDQTFAKPLTDAVGEVDSTNGTFSPGTLQRHFEMQFDIASATPSVQQPGMHTSVSPDRGDGSRMSYLRFEDGPTGINVFFDDVQQPAPCTPSGCANFVETQVGTNLSRTTPHTVKLTMDLLDGPGNDIVKVYIDNTLVHTGTSWEDYYRYDPESAAEQSPRIVKTVLFRESGTANPADQGKGFLFDNLSLSSGPIQVGPPTTKDQCKHDGWKTFNNPSFKNQGKCIDYVEKHNHKVKGDVKYTAYSLKRHAEFEMNTADNKGNFEYSDANHDWYKVKVSSVKVDGTNGYFAGKVTKASNPGWVGLWLFAKAEDNHPDQIWGSFTDITTAQNGVANMSNPADGPFNVTSGNLKVN